MKLLQRVLFYRKYTHLDSFPGPAQLSVVRVWGEPGNEANTHLVMLKYGYVKSKNQQRSNTVQDEGLTSEGRYHLLLLHKQVHDKEHHRIKRGCYTISVSQCRQNRLQQNLGSGPEDTTLTSVPMLKRKP